MRIAPQHYLIALMITVGVFYRRLCLAEATEPIDRLYSLASDEVRVKLFQKLITSGEEFVSQKREIE